MKVLDSQTVRFSRREVRLLTFDGDDYDLEIEEIIGDLCWKLTEHRKRKVETGK
jgi:hypothetical protein